MKRLLFFFCTLLCANVLLAQTRFIVGELQYEITGTNEVEVHDCMPSATSIIIPDIVTYQQTNYSVNKIGYEAFKDCRNLTSITIPNSVTSIGGWAFAVCISLDSVNIPNGVTSIGDEAFFDCISLDSVNIPNSVTHIGGRAFYDCISLTSITIPNSVTYIGYSAFQYCSSLTSVTIPNSVTEIGHSAFYGCSSLTSVTLPQNATIENNAFYDAGTRITIDSVTYSTATASLMIGFNNFYHIGFTSFYLGDNVYRNPVTNMTVYDCDTNKSGDLIIPSAIEINDIEYPVTYIGGAAFEYCRSLTSVTIPNSVTSIGSYGHYAFDGCSSLTSVICLAETAPTLVSSVFYNTPSTKTLTYPCGSDYSSWQSATTWASVNEDCSALEIGDRFTIGYLTYEVTSTNEVEVHDCDASAIQIEIPSIVNDYNVTSIGDYAFFNCSSLTSVTIPNSVTSIGERAFGRCSSLTSVTIPNSVTYIGNDTFNGCSSLDSIICLAETAPSLGSFVFHFTPSTKTLTYPCGATGYSTNWGNTTWASVNEDCPSLEIGSQFTIGDFTYEVTSANEVSVKTYNNTTATSTEIPSTVTHEGISYSVTFIQNKAFYNKDNLTSVTIPNTISAIGGGTEYYGAFEHCDGLTSITIPNSVTSIGGSAFSSCRSLTSINIPNSVISIGGSAFWGCSSLTSVTLPNNATIYYNAFENTGLINVDGIYYGGKETVNIGNYTFNNVGFITFYLDGNVYPPTLTEVSVIDCDLSKSGDIEIPLTLNGYSVTSIDSYAFFICSSLTSITIPNSVTSIGSWAFGGCSSLTSITIPNSVTSIGNDAFYNCSSLDSVICLAETAPTLESSDFYGTPSTKTLTVPFGSDYSSWRSATDWEKTYYLIQEGETKTLANDFVINNKTGLINEGVLRITQSGQLINSTSTNVSGIFEIETPILPNDKWSFIGAPLNNYKLDAIKPGTRGIAVSLFDYNTGNWSDDFATIDDEVGAGEGFFAWSFAQEPTIFTTDGEMQDYALNNGAINVTKSLRTHIEGGNWLALSNPYTFKLDAYKFLSEQSDIKGGVVYRFNGETWDAVDEGTINMTEGFFVNYETEGEHSVSFSKYHRYDGAKAKAEKEYITLNVKEGERVNKLRFAKNPKAKQGDDHYDANKLFSPIEITEPYFVTDGVALVKEEVKEFPYTANLNIRNYETKEITISIDNIPEGVNVYLIDNGYDIKMNGGVEYNTRITTGENADRFKVLFKKQHRLEQIKDNQITITNYNRHISVQSQHTDLTIEVYNQLGQKVYSTKDYNFTLTDQPAGSYMIKAFKARESETKKIVIE